MVFIARCCFAIAMVAFGLQHLVYGKFVTRVTPKLPDGVPGQALWAYFIGGLLIAAGVGLLLRKRAYVAGMLLGGLMLLSFLVLYLPLLFTTPVLGGLWTNAGKVLAMAGGAFLMAGAAERGSRGFLDGMAVAISPYFLSAFLVLAGVQHFLFVSFVASLVPGWIPGHIFWTYFAGVALIAGGVGIAVPKVRHLAALLSGIMIWLWLVLLHIPRALAAPHDANETTAVFEALAIGATAFLVAYCAAGDKSRKIA